MRIITLLVLHCSDSDVPAHDNIEVIKKWHLKRGFSDVGYHFFLNKGGSIEIGREESRIGAGVRGHNMNSIHICLSGRRDFTFAQGLTLSGLLTSLKIKYPKAEIVPHKYFATYKTCPNFYHDYIFGGINNVEVSIKPKPEERDRRNLETAFEIYNKLIDG